MKLVLLMYLEGDEACVERLLAEQGVAVYSRLPIEGVGPGARGWYGEVAPYASRMIVTMVEGEAAARLLDAVSECRGVQDPSHPIRAAMVDVERATACLCEKTGEAVETPS
ncbi:MAG: hypothetical protein R3199_07530 [Gemmatimonadota bacterium]|nr:hypothetical protein [Gemmatimonadota bacterium]